MPESKAESDQTCEAIEAVFSYGPVRCMRRAVGEAIDATWGTIHPVCAEHLPAAWERCDHHCDPTVPEKAHTLRERIEALAARYENTSRDSRVRPDVIAYRLRLILTETADEVVVPPGATTGDDRR